MKKYIKNTLGVTLLLISINAFSYSWQRGDDLINSDLQDCIEALSNGFIYEQHIDDNLNMYDVLYDEYRYEIVIFKKLPKPSLKCYTYSYEKYKPSK